MMKVKTLPTMKSLLILAMPAVLSITACTKKRDASFSEDEAEQIFAISEFGNIENDKSGFNLKTENSSSLEARAENLKAVNEKGLVNVVSANVPERLKFMFTDLQLTKSEQDTLTVYFTVDRKNVTAWKEVTGFDSLSSLEKQYAKNKDEVIANVRLQKAKTSAEREKIAQSIKKLTLQQSQNTTAKYLVPIFKYEVNGFGRVERIKNDLKEETSNLKLKSTDWEQATHIRIEAKKDALNPVGLDVTDKETLDRTFSISKLDKQVMTMKDLRENFKIQADLADDTNLFTAVDSNGLMIFEITDSSKLTESQKKTLANETGDTTIMNCSADLKTKLGKKADDDCVLVSKFTIPASYVRVKLPVSDRFGSENATARLEEVPFSNNVGLITIGENVQPIRAKDEVVYDSSTMIRISDIKDAEFFFRRTLADAPVTTSFQPGEASTLETVKFELEDSKLIVRKADRIIEYKTGMNKNDYEDLMSIPVTYLKKETKDERGNALAFPKLAKTNKEKAEFVVLNWAANSLPTTHSPIAYYGGGQCLTGISDEIVSKVDMRLNQGVLNFTVSYRAALAPTLDCLGLYSGSQDYYFASPVQFNGRLEERVSFLKKDESKFSNHQDTAFAPSINFDTQNAFGYGVWTISKFNPTKDGGLTSRQGQQNHVSVVHDFRNGRKLVYTVTNLPTDDAKRADLYKTAVKEIVSAWNETYKKAFKGIKGFERNDDYVVVQFAGENGITAEVGDLDKNIIHFENKINKNHGVLGVSQVGANPRSGIVIADSLIIYAGNLSNYVESARASIKNLQKFNTTAESFKKAYTAELAAQNQDATPASAETGTAPDSAEAAQELLAKQINKAMAKVESKMPKTNALNVQIQNLQAMKSQLNSVMTRKASLEKSNPFQYGASNLQDAWIERAFRKVVQDKKIGEKDIKAIIAEEMLTSLSSKMSANDKMALQVIVSKSKLASERKQHLAKMNGCALEFSTNDINVVKYADMSFEDAMKRALYFDLGHEMGHSQGLTHNFISSYDKANWKKSDDGTKTLTNYSSIMDYIDPSQLQWSGMGEYDAHALRASHTGLVEILPTALKIPQVSAAIVDKKFISIPKFQELYASLANGQVMTKQSMTGAIKPFAYCSDMEVGYVPQCQRFDVGGSATEIVKNLIEEYKTNHVLGYYAWDRLEFGYNNMSYAYSSTMSILFQMRQFMDEFIYMSMTQSGTEEQMKDFAEATKLIYKFMTSVILAPTASASEIAKNPFGFDVTEITNSSQKKETIYYNRLATETISYDANKVMAVGSSFDKITAMQVMTMQGYPDYKYYQANIDFTFFDIEKYIFGIKNPEQAGLGQIMQSILLGDVNPHLMDSQGDLHPLDEQLTLTPSMRSYSAILGVLGLETTTLRQSDNFANLFKVGTSLGNKPADRVSLNQLGASANSKTKLYYWAIDDAKIANNIVMAASPIASAIAANEVYKPLIQNIALLNFQKMIMEMSIPADKMSDTDKKTISDIKTKLDGNIKLLASTMKSQKFQQSLPTEAKAMQAEELATTLSEVTYLFGKLSLLASVNSPTLEAEASGSLPTVVALLQKLPALDLALVEAGKFIETSTSENQKLKGLGQIYANITEQFAGKAEVKYGIQVRTLDFLSKLTQMTNPEYSR